MLAASEAALPVDAVILGLHGAMVAHGYDDVEGDVLERARAIVGPHCVIGVELDPHCHLTIRRVRLADITILQDHDRLHYIMKDGKFHKQSADDEAPAPHPRNMPAGGTDSVGDGTTAVACAGATNAITVLHAITTDLVQHEIKRDIEDTCCPPGWSSPSCSPRTTCCR